MSKMSYERQKRGWIELDAANARVETLREPLLLNFGWLADVVEEVMDDWEAVLL